MRDLPETDFGAIIRLLVSHNVDFILIGGLAAAGHGLARATFDVDVVYSRRGDNIERLVAALSSTKPYLRGAPPDLPFRWEVKTVQMGLNFPLSTDLGDVDVLGEVVGGGRYEDLLAFSSVVPGYAVEFRLLGLEKLIELKRATGRSKDNEMIAQLEALRQEADKIAAEKSPQQKRPDHL